MILMICIDCYTSELETYFSPNNLQAKMIRVDSISNNKAIKDNKKRLVVPRIINPHQRIENVCSHFSSTP